MYISRIVYGTGALLFAHTQRVEVEKSNAKNVDL